MKKIFTYQILVLLLICTALWIVPLRSEPVALAASSSLDNGELWRRTELYFGSQKAQGDAVTEAEFEQFVDDEVTPRFPDGLTLLTGYGQFRNSANLIIEEQSFVLILLYPHEDTEANREIEEIRTAYKAAFDQESVLRVDSRERVSF